MKHKIKLEDFKDYTFYHQLAEVWGEGDCKCLEMLINPTTKPYFCVTISNKTKKFNSLKEAINTYNKG